MSDCIDPEEKAAELGLNVRRPEDNELFVDIDAQADLTIFDRYLHVIEEFLGKATFVQTASPSGEPGHYHLVVRFPGHVVFTPQERLILQLVLGSDRHREALALKQIRDGVPWDATVFFESKGI